MNERDKIIAKIKEVAYENVNKKLEEERKNVESKINYELKDVERCLQYIANKMVYKMTGKYNTNYVLANEDVFFEDYTKEVEYSWRKGIQFYDTNEKYKPVFVVNGEEYYDMRYIIRNYEEKFKDCTQMLERLKKDFDMIEEKANALIKQEPLIKNLIEQYKQVEIDELCLNSQEDD